MTTLRIGSRGSEVVTLQTALNKYGYGLGTDGVFGAKTEAAVKDYQRKHGLSVDGIVGAKTWSKLGYATNEVAAGRTINEIVIHCAATKEGSEVSSAQIDAGHKARRFSSYIGRDGKAHYIGYHYIIHLDGRVEPCRPENVRGCHAVNHNANSIGICYIGGCAADGKTPKDTRTPAQKAALVKLIKELKAKSPTIRKVIGHRDTSPDLNHNGVIEPFEYIKGCPCFDAIPEYKDLV